MNEEEKEETVLVNLKKKPLASERAEIKEKRKHHFLYFLLAVLLLVIGATGGVIGYKIAHPTTQTNSDEVIEEMAYLLKNHYLYSSQDDEFISELIDKALYGMADFEDDPYTTYMSKEELESFSSGINQSFVGVGIQFTKVDDYALVTKVLVDSPAQKAGLQEGDNITAIDGQSIADLNASQVKELALGEEGSEVALTITRDGVSSDVTVTRGSVAYTVLGYDKDDYYYLIIESFGETTAKEVMSYLDENDNKKIIIDIRNDTGGYQTSVEEVSGLFIGNNEVYLQKEDNKGNIEEARTSCSKTYDFDKIIVLVNQNTASAAEVFALALKDQLDNVTLVGETTYGKGVIQNTHMLSNGAALKFTAYYWYSPNGTSINLTGITPDVVVKEDPLYYEEYISMEEDETYEVGDVSDTIRLTEMCLNYLDYELDNTSGYFDEALKQAILSIQKEYDLDQTGVLDSDTYSIILSKAVVKMSSDENDVQYEKAVELIYED